MRITRTGDSYTLTATVGGQRVLLLGATRKAVRAEFARRFAAKIFGGAA